ncbi:MAG: alpha/beta hydrolase [Candidatus Paceibacterota bacterium]
MPSKAQFVKTRDKLEIYTESFGNPQNSAILLIMGAMNQGIFWYDSFCEELVNTGFFVIRYDHRDTGFSSVIDFKNNQYNLDDLTNDAIDILNAYKISKANIVGVSMGGYIGQLLAINYPDRVESLTLISTTADHRPYMDVTMDNFSNKYELSYPSEKFIKYIESSKNNPPKTEEEFKNAQVEGWKIFFGKELLEEDLKELIKLIDLSNKRNKNKVSPFNHGLAVANSKDRLEIVKNIKAPTLIIHGENDVCFLVDHSKYLNSQISNSRLEIIKDMGHMFSLGESIKIVKYIEDFILIPNCPQ